MNQLLNRKNNEFSVKKKKGFTLIELIIVIAIIAILAAIAIPKFGAVRKDANVAADQANAKIISTAVSTAVSKGEVVDGTSAVASSKYSIYIDGGQVPVPKSGGTAFTVHYTDALGVVVKIDDTTQMYPIS
jgi:type IV pilus assembly protein PilA